MQLNRGGVADLSFMGTLLAIQYRSWEQGFWELMDSFVSLAYGSLAASRTLLQQLLACLNFTLDLEDLFCWYKRKKISMNYGTRTSSWKPLRWWGLTWYLQWGVSTSVSTRTHLQSSLAAAEALNLKISFHGTFPKWLRRPSQLPQE